MAKPTIHKGYIGFGRSLCFTVLAPLDHVPVGRKGVSIASAWKLLVDAAVAGCFGLPLS